jgi:transposase InsO family protein
VQKRRKRDSTADARMGPKEARSTTLTPEQEAMIVAFPRHRLLPLDDCLYALQPSVPALTRSSLHRCLQRHGISRLPKAESASPGKGRFKAYPIGYVHIDIAEVRSEQGRLYLFVAVDRTSKLAFAQLRERATRRVAADFLHALVEALPYKLHTVLTDNGVQCTDTLPADEDPEAAIDAIWAARGEPRLHRVHAFDHACERHGVEHRLTKPYHPWTNGQAERMNRTLKDATVRRYHYGGHGELRAHLALFLDAHNHARRLKALRGLTPHEFVCRAWTRAPERFRLNPLHHNPGTEHLEAC